MKKHLLLISSLFIFTACGTPEETVDLTTLYSQVCETENGPCKKMTCTLSVDTYKCFENIADIDKNCSAIKTKDEVVSKYKVCGFEESDKYQIYNYGANIELLSLAETPAEFTEKIKEETENVENGGTSDFLSTMMAVAGGSIIGGLISNALFNRSASMPPKQAPSAYERPFNKESLDKTKSDTAQNSDKIKKSVASTQAKAQKAADKLNNKKKTVTKKKSTTRSKRRRR